MARPAEKKKKEKKAPPPSPVFLPPVFDWLEENTGVPSVVWPGLLAGR